MQTKKYVFILGTAAALLIIMPGLGPVSTPAQVPPYGLLPPPMPVPVTPESQRAAMTNVRTRIQWLQNATRTAPGYATGGDGLVWRSLQALRLEYDMFTRTLTPGQADYGANDLAELGAGIDILQEALVNYQNDLGAGRSPARALTDMCQVLKQGANVWLQEFNRVCQQLRVGRP